MMNKLCSLSVDLDPLTAYYEIHGLGEPPLPLRTTILRKALPRFEELFAEADVRATFFIVGRDLEQGEEAQDILKRLAASGHELGNHTYSHPYDLCRSPETVIDSEIQQAHQTIATVIGPEYAPVGFRAPGYTINGKVARVLVDHGYQYDSSMFPSPPYYMAKIGIMMGMHLRGRRSGAVISDPRGLLCPPDPYRPDLDHPWHRGNAPLMELPIAVLPFSRFPAIGTFLAVSPERWRRYCLNMMRSRSFFNLELHGIDLADAIADRIPTELAGRQPDLRVPFRDKRERFLQTLKELKTEYTFVTLKEAATRLKNNPA